VVDSEDAVTHKKSRRQEANSGSVARVARAMRRGPAPKLKDDESGGARADILAVATHDFSEKGLAGARVDEIAERTHTSKRMIYYYFQSKEGLYRSVLERCYVDVRQIDSDIDLEALGPIDALRELVRVTFDYHTRHPDFVRLVMNENIHRAEHIRHIPSIKSRNQTIISMMQRLINRGVQSGQFRADLDPVELHMTISALCFYNVSNRHTFGWIFQRDMTSADALARRREVIVDIVERWCRA
jgi:AcrR family transcriptional regulator